MTTSDPLTLREWQHEARMALNTHEAYPLPDAVAEAQRRIVSLTAALLDGGAESVARTVGVSAVEWAGLLARAFEQGKQAAYLAERDGGDGSEVRNPYGLAPQANAQTTLTALETTLRADRAEDALRERERQLARVLEMADAWEAEWSDGKIRANIAADAIRRTVRGIGRA